MKYDLNFKAIIKNEISNINNRSNLKIRIHLKLSSSKELLHFYIGTNIEYRYVEKDSN